MDVQLSARERLLDAADDLAFTQGVAATPVDEILRRANVAPATLYSHFGNKEGLIVQALQRRLTRWDEAWQQEISEAPTAEGKLVAVLPAIKRYRAGASAARWCAFLGVAAESAHPGHALQETLSSDTQLLTARLHELAIPVVGHDRAAGLAGQLVLIFTGVLGMILRGTDTEAAVDMGLRTAAAAIGAAAGRNG
ncbi:TetR/AcrR family transcriptional regulator [Arthrobacter sp. zg-Y1219]|uniref:TetR/AcrR family transcriptional regulator n=1 Tax=Arthrobacter sp. zg-Y1219 TaxID=3049067 RepID=UPI0024C3D867|nr:TetR/AcrR family transcriptional regulator [Arthrobacter sp. zg-Y1219]MDK1359879.1 TetR/AcrR family transcriptional regulator [Arthrobacter sp. zg-Y1219]